MKKSDPLIIVQNRFDLPKRELWELITDPEHMKIWFFPQIPEFSPEKGFETAFLVETEERKFTHSWKIIDVEVEGMIVYDWSYREYPGKGYVKFELEEKYGYTNLILTNEVVEDFPDNIPEFSWQSCLAGWEFFIKQSLPKYIEIRSL